MYNDLVKTNNGRHLRLKIILNYELYLEFLQKKKSLYRELYYIQG